MKNGLGKKKKFLWCFLFNKTSRFWWYLALTQDLSVVIRKPGLFCPSIFHALSISSHLHACHLMGSRWLLLHQASHLCSMQKVEISAALAMSVLFIKAGKAIPEYPIRHQLIFCCAELCYQPTPSYKGN